jgi:hypothetical protein
MRFINRELALRDPRTADLIATAERLTAELVDLEDAEARRDLIKRNRAAWTGFRSVFEDIYGRKCWYTESRNPGTDDDIDHFRPKNRVSESPDHGGYWWESFNWENFRLSSHRANRLRESPESGNVLGKGDHVPLIDEARRWLSPADSCDEEPMLLDPTDPEDSLLITFDIDGRVAVSPSHEESSTVVDRVNASRELLHLDWSPFVEDRRDLYVRILGQVRQGDNAELTALEGAARGRAILKQSAESLIAMTHDRQAYSRAAAAYIRTFKDRDWIDRAVLPHIPFAA